MADTAPLLEELRRELGRTLVATDFDGTLSPIVDDPATAVLAPGAAPVLEELTRRAAEVAVISGRPLAYLSRRLPEGPTLVGLYGLERRQRGETLEHPEAPRWRDVVTEVVERARTDAPEGTDVESKDLSLTLHYRRHPDLADAVAALAERLSTSSGLELRAARMSVELHPPIEEDKGTALSGLAALHSGPVVFLGDDVGDLAAFDALDAVAAQGRTVLRVLVASDESPPLLRERADLAVDGPEGAVSLLRSILGSD